VRLAQVAQQMQLDLLTKLPGAKACVCSAAPDVLHADDMALACAGVKRMV
jgi:hypothetical protein